MKYKIRNKRTMMFVSKETKWNEANNWQKKLGENFEVVPIEEAKDSKDPFIATQKEKFREVTKAELAAIDALVNVKVSGNKNHLDFINSLLFAKNSKMELTEKQIGYLWGLVWHYRSQIQDGKLIVLAQNNRTF